MKYLLPVALLLSLSAHARTPEEKKALLEKQDTCQNFVRFDEQNLYMGFGAYQRWGEYPRTPFPGQVTIAGFDGTKTTINTTDAAIDVVVDNGRLFVLTFTAIEEWDMSSMTKVAEYETSTQNDNTYKSHAESWARYNDTMVIAHGSQGITFFDLKAKKLTGSLALLQGQLPLESQATAISIIGSTAYIGMDSLTLVNEPPFPFRGIVTVNLEGRTLQKELPGFDPGIDAFSSFGNKIVASYFGQPIWKYDVTKFKGNKLPNPEIRIFKFPVPGHPIGFAEMDEKYYYSCFTYHDLENMQTYQKPIVMNRKALMLD